MTHLALLAAAATGAAPQHLDPVRLFLDADIVVQVVMAGLILASLWVWTIIVGFSLRHRQIVKACDTYERDFWKAADIDAFQAEFGKGDVPSARVAAAGVAEWRRSLGGKAMDREGTRQRLAQVMDSTIAQEADRLSERLNFLATVGAVSNPDHMNENLGKAGRSRHMGRRPHVRGVAMNPIDHPHGGGEGRTSGGRHPVTPWGKGDRKSTRLNSSHSTLSRMPSSA